MGRGVGGVPGRVGARVGFGVGKRVGNGVGRAVGALVVGLPVGARVGLAVVGFAVVGARVGAFVGGGVGAEAVGRRRVVPPRVFSAVGVGGLREVAVALLEENKQRGEGAEGEPREDAQQPPAKRGASEVSKWKGGGEGA